MFISLEKKKDTQNEINFENKKIPPFVHVEDFPKIMEKRDP